uniref:Dynein axonemal assembly factor 9 n=1 Tax=Gadus morhua TaxID=8049 RepID=A0A8C5F5I4_GADMO
TFILNILRKTGGSPTADGVLCVLGIDSRYNAGCTELANFLFYGLYGKNQMNLDHVLEEFPEEVLDDVILLIQWDCVHLYCNPVNYSYLLPYVSHWRNLHLYCLTPSEYEDEEAAEEFKISSFVSMMKDCSCVRVPFSSQGHMQNFHMFMLEKWPIVQAFALEGIGGGSFFTMKYKVGPGNPNPDPDLVNFEKQWSNFFSSMDLESHLSIQEVSEAQAGEVFRSYYSHGLISSNIPENSKARQPFMLFGSHSSKEELESYSFNFPSESHVVRSTGTHGGPATHMVLQCVAPKGPLACARTYFFGTTHSPYLGKNTLPSDLQLLSQIYSAVVQAVLAGIKCFSCSSSSSKAKDVAEQTFLLALESLNLCQYRSALRSKSEFTIQAVNNEGRVVPLSDEGSRYMVKTASMTVADIPDLQRGGGDLGSVVFSECFLESSINIQQKGADSPELYPPMIYQTTGVIVSEEDTCLGRALTGADGAYVCSSSLLSTPEEGTLQHHRHHRPRTFSTDSEAVASLFVEYDNTLLDHLPFPLQSPDQCLLFALQPRSKSHKAFFSKVGPAPLGSPATWPSPGLWSSLTCTCTCSHTRTQTITLTHSHTKRSHLPCQSLTHTPSHTHNRILLTHSLSYSLTKHCVLSTRFLQHFSLSSVGQEPILNDHLGALFPSADLRTPLTKYTDVLEVIQAILSHPDPLVQACFSIGAVTACVEPLSSCMEHRFTFPKLVEQCSQGVVSAVVFTGPSSEVKHPSSQYLHQLLRAANPSAAFIQAEGGAVTRNEDVKLILSDSSFNQSQMLRRSSYPSCPCVVCCPPAALKSSLTGNPFRGNLYHVWGKVRFADSERRMEVSYNALSGALTVTPDRDPTQGTAGCFLLFHGVGLTPDGLKDWLRLCAKQKEMKKVKRTRNSISPQEIKSIHASRHLEPMPSGFFYNGHHFMDIFGEKRLFHPNMEQFIREYVCDANREIELFNSQLDLQTQPDLFDPPL